MSGLRNALGLVVVWVHGCWGLFEWSRYKSWFNNKVAIAYAALFPLVPILALLGYLSAGREIAPKTLDGEWMEQYYASLGVESFEWIGEIGRAIDLFYWAFLIVLLSVPIVRFVRILAQRRLDLVEIDYLDGPTIKHPQGDNLLDISIKHEVPHASVCGGKGRCSTCRIRLLQHSGQNPPGEREKRVLEGVDAGTGVRLACQFVPTGSVQIARLFPAEARSEDAQNHTAHSSGVEKTVAILFADIRDFTQQSEQKLPFDVVYLVNQFAESMGEAITRSGGRIDKFLGDGLMALFGIDTSPQIGCRQALKAANEMLVELEALNTKLASSLDRPLKMGIGIHAGPVVLGDMGYGKVRSLSAIGDAVNTASRLESATKETGSVLCISKDVLNFADVELPEAAARSISIRGKQKELSIFALSSMNDIAIHRT
ncbi:MAG: adenylate/guanylate cyclase domain-containing protein [Pseudomonadota bacterium]